MSSLPGAASQRSTDCGTAAACRLSSAEMQAILRDPATSFWLRQAVAALQARDPLDALHDAQLLHRAMCGRFNTLLQEAGHGQAE